MQVYQSCELKKKKSFTHNEKKKCKHIKRGKKMQKRMLQSQKQSGSKLTTHKTHAKILQTATMKTAANEKSCILTPHIGSLLRYK